MIAPDRQKPAGILIDPLEDDRLFVQSLESAMTLMLAAGRRAEYADAARALGDEYSMDKLVSIYEDLYTGMIADADHGTTIKKNMSEQRLRLEHGRGRLSERLLHVAADKEGMNERA